MTVILCGCTVHLQKITVMGGARDMETYQALRRSNLACLPPTRNVQSDGKLLRFLQNGSRMQLNTVTELLKERKHLRAGESLVHEWDPFPRNKNCRILSKYGTADGRAKILSCHKPPQKKFGKAGGNARMWNSAGVCGSHSTIWVSR
jgi:hypothetical protein